MKQNKNRRKEKEKESIYIHLMVMFVLLYKVKKNHLNTPFSFEIFLDPRQVLVSWFMQHNCHFSSFFNIEMMTRDSAHDINWHKSKEK